MINLLFGLLLSAQAAPNVIEGRFGKQEQVLTYAVAIPPEMNAEVKDILSAALSITNAVAPSGLSLQPVRAVDAQFLIEIINSDTAIKNAPDEKIKMFSSGNGDAYSMLFSEVPDSPIIVRVLWDKAMTMKVNGKTIERSDAFTRLTVLLGHEIYGNVVYLRKNRLALSTVEMMYNKRLQHESWIKSEVNAFQSGVSFIERLQKANFGLPAKMLQDFADALVREKDALKSYTEIENGVKSEGNVVSLFKNSCREKLKGD